MKGFSDMGLTHVAVEIRKFGSAESYTSTFLVDTGAMDSMVPGSELRKLGIQPVGRKMSFLGEVIGTRIIFGAEQCEPLLGVVALQSAGFIVEPAGERLRRMRAKPLKAVTLKSVA